MEINLKQVWDFVKPRAWMIALCAVLGAVIAFVYTSFFVTPMYISTAKVYVYNNDRQNMQISAGDLNASQQLIKTYIAIMQSDNVMQKVADEVNLGYSAGQIRSMFSASEVNETEIFKISIRNPNPEHAQKIVAAILKVSPEPIKRTVKAGSVEIVDGASLPKTPASPNVPKSVVIGFLLGAILCAGVLVLFNVLDRRIHSDEDISDMYAFPILGIIPEIDDTATQTRGI